jgi:hypothetical protein
MKIAGKVGAASQAESLDMHCQRSQDASMQIGCARSQWYRETPASEWREQSRAHYRTRSVLSLMVIWHSLLRYSTQLRLERPDTAWQQNLADAGLLDG